MHSCLDSLTIEDIGNACWNPIAYVSPAGFCYYFPALARLSLDEPDDFYGWYFRQLLFFLTNQDAEHEHLRHCTSEQRETVLAFTRHVAATRRQLIESESCEDDLQKALSLWSR